MCSTELSLIRHCGLTFARCKAASLFTIYKEDLDIISTFSNKFYSKGFRFYFFKNCNDRLLLYVYHIKSLNKILFNEQNKNFLAKFGYNYTTVNEALDFLSSRLKSSSFPHEIGIFLDYPLDDVLGFTYNRSCSLCHKYWRVYSNKEEKLKVFHRLDKCNLAMLKKFYNGLSLSDIFLLN